jgi:hypothetical protein
VAHLLEPAVDELYLLSGEFGRPGEFGELLGAVSDRVDKEIVQLLLWNRNTQLTEYKTVTSCN